MADCIQTDGHTTRSKIGRQHINEVDRNRKIDRQTAIRMASQKVLEGQNAGAETLHDRILIGSGGSMLGWEMDGQTAYIGSKAGRWVGGMASRQMGRQHGLLADGRKGIYE